MSDAASNEAVDARHARLFVALDPPQRILGAIGSWQEAQAVRAGGTVGGERRLRAVAPQSLHVTLVFLGDRPLTAIDAVAEALAGLSAGPVEATLLPEPIPVPRRHPRLLAFGVESPGAVRLEAELSRRLTEIGLHRPKERRFWPHLTAFRVGRRRRPPGSRTAIPRVEPIAVEGGHAFGFVRVALYRSDLRPEGASYSRLAANELPQPGGRQKR
jgi:2'-5' RNA ligase